MRTQFGTRPVTFAIAAVGVLLAVIPVCLTLSPLPPDRTETKTASNPRHAESSESSSKGGSQLGPLDAKITGNVYTNRFFGFSLTVPEGWKVLPNLIASPHPRSNIGANEDQPLTLLLLVENVPGKPPLQWRRAMVLANKLKDPKVS